MNAEPTQPKPFRDHLRTLRRHVRIIVFTTVIAAAIAGVTSARKDKTYQATATMSFIDPSSQAGQVGGLPANTPATTLSASGVARINAAATLTEVKAKLRTPLSIDDLRGDINAVASPATNLVSITVTAKSAGFSANLANAIARQAKADGDRQARAAFARLASQIDDQIRSLTPKQRRDTVTTSALIQRETTARALSNAAITAQITALAQRPQYPTSPKPVRSAIVGGFLGLILGLILAAVRESFDRRLQDPSEIEAELDAPVIGRIREEFLGGRPLEADLEPYRILRTNVEFLTAEPPKTVLVTSALPEEGKSTVAASLAVAAAAAGRRTLLVECDLRRPKLPGRFGIDQAPGLSDYLAGHASPSDVLRRISIAAAASGAEPSQNGDGIVSHLGELIVIPAGSRTEQTAELLGSPRFKEFLAQVRDVYDLVVLDTCPLLPVADTLALLNIVDTILLCVRASKTSRGQLRAAKTTISHFPARPMGAVITGLRDPGAGDGYADPYAYDYRPDRASASRS